ncbi:hypothetical protein FNP_0406 [Fusobacterium polymorphum ATCC 10953]|uniref:Uncharacterized protein n=1 Tax=Fusobacterium polymorphum ATCC 10953 TaxID=393480 RepID=A5TTJ2_FUSNP|nr:hypothetical protein FNP_0406 [Fusobacterium polymorphum ATCC 10953]
MWLIKAHTSQEAPTSTSGSSSLYVLVRMFGGSHFRKDK